MASEKRGVAVVTGASTGIGKATALDLCARGFDVFAGIRKKADGEAIKEETGGEVTPLMIDVTKPQSIARAKGTVSRRAGKAGVAALVNNAGIAVAGPLELLPLDEFRRQLEVNLTGHLAVTQAMLPLLRKARGRIVNITSIGGRVAYPFNGPYHASKWGLEAISDSLRTELQPWGIDVIVIEPGSIATEIWDRGLDKAAELRSKMGRQGERLYGPAFDSMTKTMRDSGDAGIPAEKAAAVIGRALTAERPKTRYLIGRDAKGTLLGRRLLSDRRWDRLVTRMAKLPKRDSAVAD
jgi:NAD(P)-dependent dehydrogenase (short-subunit alcohol dehydrogenase family)